MLATANVPPKYDLKPFDYVGVFTPSFITGAYLLDISGIFYFYLPQTTQRVQDLCPSVSIERQEYKL